MIAAWLTVTCRVREADVPRAEACLEQAGRLLATYSDAFKMQTQRQLGEWMLIAGVRDDA
jgi:hypothetical protein